jgi:hypothetical protein
MAIDRNALLQALATITTARREAQILSDDSSAATLASGAPVTDEQLPQTLGGLVRQLDNAARELADAIRTVDRGDRLSGAKISA